MRNAVDRFHFSSSTMVHGKIAVGPHQTVWFLLNGLTRFTRADLCIRHVIYSTD